MLPLVEAHLGPDVEAGLLLAAALPAGVYATGWWRLHRERPARFGPGRLAAFLGGIAAVLIALATPLDHVAEELLSAHMTQHLLLMLVAPPLVWLGRPLAPLLRGLPPGLRQSVARGLASPPVRALGRTLGHPAVCWATFSVTLWAWHAPALYELALRDPLWHDVEHLCFLGTGLLFWWPIVLPWPARARGSRWLALPYLGLAALQNTVLSAIFVFSDRLLYPSYAAAPALEWGIAPLTDQALAGAIMWVPGSLVMLAPVVAIVLELLTSDPSRGALRTAEHHS